MNPVFLDTSGLLAVVNNDDYWHSSAEKAWLDLIKSSALLITTSLVLIEIGDGLSRLQLRQMAIDLYDRLHASPRVVVIHPTSEDEEAGWELFRRRADKEWGMTDCVSMVVMHNRNVADVFSADHHFEQAGFSVLLRSS
jgi:uncharacterized protein